MKKFLLLALMSSAAIASGSYQFIKSDMNAGGFELI